jgi:dihydroflavonol-4-reductase
MTGTILVTGGSGYIAGFLIRQLADLGWRIHTTIRDPSRQERLRAILGVPTPQLTIFTADLTADAGWAEAVAGCSHVAHVASPIPSGAIKHEDELIVPARDGTLRVLRSATAAGVKRFVMTSSTAAVAYGRVRSGHRYTEVDWTDPNYPGLPAYAKSKTIAERSARDWVANYGGGLEFCTVNPAIVFGPLMSRDFSESIMVLKRTLEGAWPGFPNVGFGLADVRDVADLHVRALNAYGMANERFIASGPFYWMIELGRILRERLGAEAQRVPTKNLPNPLVRLAAFFDPMVRQVTGELGIVRELDAGHAKKILDWTPRSAEETLFDTARGLIDWGIVKLR